MLDQLRKPLESCFFLFCADDPIGCHPLVPRRLSTEEFPSGLVGAKLFRFFTIELDALALFVSVDAGLFYAASGKNPEAGGMHQALLCELLNEFDVNGAPGAGEFARSEANHVAGFVDALWNAVDPAEAQCNLYGFGPGDAELARTFFVEADEKFLEYVVVESFRVSVLDFGCEGPDKNSSFRRSLPHWDSVGDSAGQTTISPPDECRGRSEPESKAP